MPHLIFVIVFVSFMGPAIADNCHDPPDVMNADWTVSRINTVKAEYTCHTGFSPLGNNYISCSQGKWSTLGFYCQAKDTCPPLSLPDNAIELPRSGMEVYYVGTEVQISCQQGYVIQGGTTRTCLAGGEWSGNETKCVAEEVCPPLTLPENTEWSLPSSMSGSLHVGDNVYFNCIHGYRLLGSAQRTCMSGGEWSGDDTHCERAGCEVPPVDHMVQMYLNGYAYGDVIEFKCSLGYKLQGTDQSECLESGSWSPPPPRCHPVVCGDPGHPNNGRRIGLVYSFGSKVTFDCDPGFVISGHHTIFCQADGEWTRGTPTCIRILCPVLYAPEHGGFFPTEERSAGTLVRFRCNPPYMLRGEKGITCLNNGTWSNPMPTCQYPDCGEPLNVTTNGVTYSPQGSTNYGTIIEFSCSWNGDTLEGFETSYCESDGKWSHPTPICRKQCPQKNIDHGFWKGGSVAYTEHNSQAEFSCSSGHTAPNGYYVTCRDGTWEPKPWCPEKKPWWCFFTPNHKSCTVY